MAWFEENPDLLQRELHALEAAGLSCTVDESARQDEHLLRLEVSGTIEGDTHTWMCAFPDAYPYFPPFVTGPDRGYRYHHHPDTGQYCLLRDGDGGWKPSMTLAQLLREQWPKFLAAQRASSSSEATPALEVQQAEPWTQYLQYEDSRQSVLWDATLEPPESESAGFIEGVPLGKYNGFKWLALVRSDLGGQHVAGRDLGEVAREIYAAGREETIPWVRLASAPGGTDPAAWWEEAARAWEVVRPAVMAGKKKSGGAVTQLLVTFPEEVGHRELGWGWVLVRAQRRGKPKTIPPTFQRVVRVGPDDLARRAPALAPIQDRRVLVAGLGGLGSQIVRLLAQTSPAELVLWDPDVVEADTAVRWAGALAMDGVPKAVALAHDVLDTQAHTRLELLGARVGHTRGSMGQQANSVGDQHGDLVRRLPDLDLVVDATANRSVQHYLSVQARDHGVAYMRADAQYGVWSGLVGLQRPGGEVCWMCWMHHVNDQTIPTLLSDPDGEIQPPGCGAPTYVGTAFDLAPIAAESVRMATSYLTETGEADRHPFDVMTLRLRDHDGRLTVPTWEGHELERHPACPNHG
ncbi:hypothetical protein ASG49_04290 [Marmoricola sp. Leaf446]|uniref:ThiF family adenylyltransferase n=1 Tax=Marmoricola sp. Leaf446 TaxID=1736379 RepID=UPI0006F37907|nr:ThiF family adenylyltransferase [Marmoricola sp. Leaf446]KQT94136.1 hypothetical protein ASG49_04290 [Marmoricola sp. Leaf446]